MNKSCLMMLVPLWFLGACGTMDRSRAENYNQAFMQGKYCQAAEVATGEGVCEDFDGENFDDMNLLDALNGGSAMWDCHKKEISLKLFESADQYIAAKENASLLEDTGVSATAIMANQSILDYQPMVMDGIYLSSYKILNYLALNDKEAARNEVNRAYSRQQNAADVFSKEIAAEEEAAAEESNDLSKGAKQLLGEEHNKILAEYNAEFSQWNSYKNYLNPYTTYLSGIFFLNNSTGASDNETAVTYLKRVSGMAPNNKFVKQDLALAEKIANGKTSFNKSTPMVWVVFENGMGADFKEFRIDLPVFIATGKVKMVDFAIPQPKLRNSAFDKLSVAFEGDKMVETELLADVDRMFISEYNKKFPAILSQAIAATTAKAVMQYVAQEQMGDLGGISMAVYSMVTASADLRSWYALPKNVQIAKISNKKGGKLGIYNQAQKITEIEVSGAENVIVYVRIPEANAMPAVSIINL